jgi:hypothetical protein
MSYLPCDANLVAKSFETYGVTRQRPREELERHRGPEHEIVGAIDLTHPTAAEAPDDPKPIVDQTPSRVLIAMIG